MKKIIFENSDKSIDIIHPTPTGYVLGMKALGEKNTPTGLPFWIVEEEVIPQDRSERNTWELDGTQGPPDGYGS